MNIAIVCPYALDRPGGVQAQAIEGADQLRQRGHQVRLIGPGRTSPVDAMLVGREVSVPANQSRVPLSLDPRTVRRLRSALAGMDLVHLHEPLVPLIGLATMRLAPGPLVVTFHSDPSPRIRRLLARGSGLARRWGKRITAATAVSPVAAGAVEPLAGTVTIVPNAIDVVSYRLDLPRHPRRVVFVGRDEPRKGLDVLLDAWPGVRASLPEAELMVVGGRRSPQPGVRYLGVTDEAEKRRVLAGAAILCAPNLGRESFGIVLAEGLAAGCRVVAADLPAFRFVLGETGTLVPPGDATALARALVADLRDEPTSSSEAARRRRAAEFDWSVVLDRYLAIYEQAVAGRR